MFYKSEDFISACKKENKHLWNFVLEEEKEHTGLSYERIKKRLSEMLNVMESSSKDTLFVEHSTRYGMIDGFAKKMETYSKSQESITGDFLTHTMAMAFSTLECNAFMGRIVASPTAGSAGILPAVLMSMKEKYGYDDEKLIEAMLTAVGIGKLIGEYASFSGADGGCQAETGSAAAMAAAACVFLRGGSPEMCFNAASFALLHVLGLVCDPIAGLVEYPCTFRNASGAMNALFSADMALAGITSFVPFEEICQAMRKVGKELSPALRETGLGGVAGTKTGQRIRREFLGILGSEEEF